MDPLRTKIRKTLNHHGRTILRRARAFAWRLARPMADRPIFIIGCSRAGTTLVYKTFSESRALGSLQRETHDFWAGFHPLGARGWSSHALAASDASVTTRAEIARHFFAHTGRHRWVDKNNQNGLCVPYLHALFPDAHFVFVTRNPGDNLNSLIEGWLRPEEFATWSRELPARVAVDGRLRQWCFFLAEGWRDYLEAPLEEVCAFQYRALNEAVLAARDHIPGAQWCEIRYEDILSDPVAVFRRAFEACDLPFDGRLESHCRAVLGKPYNAFSPVAMDKWQHGPHHARIARVMPALEPLARQLGYGRG